MSHNINCYHGLFLTASICQTLNENSETAVLSSWLDLSLGKLVLGFMGHIASHRFTGQSKQYHNVNHDRNDVDDDGEDKDDDVEDHKDDYEMM